MTFLMPKNGTTNSPCTLTQQSLKQPQTLKNVGGDTETLSWPTMTQVNSPVSSLGTVLEELLAGFLLEPVCTLNQHGLLHLRHMVLRLQKKKQKGTGEHDDSVLMVKSTG